MNRTEEWKYLQSNPPESDGVVMLRVFPHVIRKALAFVGFSIAMASLALAGTVSLSAPTADSTVTSPLRVAASASSSYSIVNFQIYLDGSVVASVSGSKTIDKTISASAGQH